MSAASIKSAIIAAVQAAADATDNPFMRVSLGAPGDEVEIYEGQLKGTGSGWEPTPKPFDLLVEGIAEVLFSSGVGVSGFHNIQQFPSSDTIPAGCDLAETTAGGITLSLPAPASVPDGAQVVVKNTGLGSNFVNVNGGGNIDAGPVMAISGIYEALRFYKASGQWWTW